MKGSTIDLSIVDKSAIASLPNDGLSDAQRPTGLVAAFGPAGDDQLYIIDGGLGTRMGTYDNICGGYNPLYGDEQIAARAVLAGGSNLALLNLAAPGARKAQAVGYVSMQPAFGPRYLADPDTGALSLEEAGNSYQFANAAAMIMGGETLRANAEGTLDLSNQGTLPASINTQLATADLTGVVNFPIFGIEYNAPGRTGNQIFAQIERAESDVFNEFNASLFYIQFGRRVNSADTMYTNKILFSLSQTDQIFEATVVFIDKLGNETIERLTINIYKQGIEASEAYLKKIAQEAIITDGDGNPLTLFDGSLTGNTPDDHASTFGSYDILTCEDRQRNLNGDAITDYNLLRYSSDFNAAQEAASLPADVEVVDGFENETGILEFFTSDGHDGMFDAISPSDAEGNPVTIEEVESAVLNKLYSAYSGSLIPKIKDTEITRFNFMVDSLLPFEIKSAMVDLAKSKVANHTFGIYYAGETILSSMDDALAVKKYRLNVVGDVSECMEIYAQSYVCTNPDVSPIAKRVPLTIDIAFKIGMAYNSVEKLMRPFAGKYTGIDNENKFAGLATGEDSSIDFFPDRTMNEHDTLTDNRINYLEESVEGCFQMSDVTNNTAVTRLSSARNKRILSIIYLWLYAFLSKKRFIPGTGLSEIDKININDFGAKWATVITGITVINITTKAEADNGIYNYTYDIPFLGVPHTYKGVIQVLNANAVTA